MLCQELDIYYQYMYMTLSIIDMDFLYQFNLRLIAPLFTVSFHEMFEKLFFQDFQKLAGLWLVGEMDNHVGIYGSKVAEGFSAFQRRSCYICRLIGNRHVVPMRKLTFGAWEQCDSSKLGRQHHNGHYSYKLSERGRAVGKLVVLSAWYIHCLYTLI